jgi:superfamily II DNA or RNA helicase
MTGRPDVIDNLPDGTTHRDALAYLAADLPDRPISVAVGYVNLGGLHHLATTLDPERPVRLLLGAEPERGLGEALPTVAFSIQLDGLAGERDLSRFPPSRAAKRMAEVERWLAASGVEVHRYVTRFLHGKAYLIGDLDDPRAALVTSANLTHAGLSHNLELGMVDYNPGPSRAALGWFEGLWREAPSFKSELQALLFPGIELVDPEDAFLRALLELYGDELAEAEVATAEVPRVPLASFQRDGYERARRILERHGGVVYADGVGTGKTSIGLAFIEQYALREGRNALVVAPAQLAREWQRHVIRARLPAQVISFQDLARDEQLVPEARQRKRVLDASKDAYRLVIVDEAHALRNEDTTWHRAMDRLLGGERKDVVLLTATPVNNGLWDLYSLVMLFGRHDRAFARVGVPSARELFVRAGANERDPENLDPDVLFPLADAVSVRRDRAFIEQRYPGATFPDGTPVRFPVPHPETKRYDLDAAHPGLFGEVVTAIDSLTMARYRPSAFLVNEEEDSAETQLGGLLQSGLLKRFESCWAACLATVGRMVTAHDAFLAAWGDGHVLSKATLREAARADAGETGLAGWVAEKLEADEEARSGTDFLPEYGEAVTADREQLVRIRDLLAALSADNDPKLALLTELLESTPAAKVAIFATYGETVAYLDEHLPASVRGRERVTVIGGETSPDERMGLLARFSPRTVVADDYVPPDGEVDLLLSTDVLSEGQNLQQAQAVVSYDMPWNPQRVVQRNGRVIRLLSPHEEVFLTTMLPAPGELEELLRLEARVRAKILAASIYGMESEILDGVEAEHRVYAELSEFADRLAGGEVDAGAESEDSPGSGAFVGEELRARLTRARDEGELPRLERLPWGIGAVIRATPGSRPRGRAGVFFAARTRPLRGAEEGLRYWRFVEFEPATGDDGVVDRDLEMLRRIDPLDADDVGDLSGVDLEGTWTRAAASIVAEHNHRADPRTAQEAIGPAQRFALDLLRDPSVVLPEGAEEAADALAVERSSSVRRALNEVKIDIAEERVERSQAATLIVGIVQQLGLRAVELDEPPEEIDEGDLGVVCWVAVLD